MLEELKELGIDLPDVNVRVVDLAEGEQFSEEFMAHSPNQKIPALVDGDRSIMETGAILQYLAEKYPTSMLPLDESRWDVLQWLFWQVANLGPVFGNKLAYTRYLDHIEDERKTHPLERFNNEAQRLLRVLNKQLESGPYICGEEYTIADIAAWPWVRGWKWSKIDITLHDNVVAWVKRVRARPAVERGIAYGMPEEEIDQWTEDTKARYKRMGSSIAANERIASDT